MSEQLWRIHAVRNTATDDGGWQRAFRRSTFSQRVRSLDQGNQYHRLRYSRSRLPLSQASSNVRNGGILHGRSAGNNASVG
jgi:hypothetical protein